MGFFDKVKNMFTEEVEDEVKVEQVKKEIKRVSIDSSKTKEAVENFELSNFNDEDIKLDSKTVFFDDTDFEDLKLNTQEQVKYETKNTIEKDVYGKKLEEKKVEKKTFKPTPIISPVYGILDKNYHKEDIVAKEPASKPVVKEDIEPSIDSIRNKAYGTLEDELENTLFGNNSILFKKVKEEQDDVELEKLDDDILENLTDDISKELDELLLSKEKYLQNEEKTEVTDDLLDFIDSTLYKDGEEE